MDLEKIIEEEQDKYVNGYNDNLEYEDEEFDAILDYLPNKPILIGAKSDMNKVKLEYPMPSLNKITYGKDDLKALTKFMAINPGPYMVSSKVDGTSLQLVYKDGKVNIYTGGDGEIGKDVTFLAEYLNLPEIEEDVIIRGELSITIKDFEKMIPRLQKNGNKAKNSRGVLNAMVNRKDIDKKTLKKCFFIGFGVLSSTKSIKKQYKKLKEYGFVTPDPIKVSYDDPSEFLEFLFKELTKRNKNRTYRIDGLVIVDINNFEQVTECINPIFAFAFKINTVCVSKIKEIKWQVTRYGYKTPVAIIKEVTLIGSDMNRASAVHAKEVVELGLGPGAIVLVTFAGDIIPKITKCIKPAEVTLPDDCHWCKNNVQMVVNNPKDYPKITILNMVYFIKVVGVEKFGYKKIKALYNNGITSLNRLLRIKYEDMDDIPGFKDKTKNNLIDGLAKAFKRLTWAKIMTASGVFEEDLAETRLQSMIDAFPNWLVKTPSYEEILTINGIAEILGTKLHNGLPLFKDWINKNKMCTPLATKKLKKEKLVYKGEVIVFTGFTNDELKNDIEMRGGIVKKSFVNSATLIVAKKLSATSNKIKKATEKGIRLISIENFLVEYNKKTKNNN